MRVLGNRRRGRRRGSRHQTARGGVARAHAAHPPRRRLRAAAARVQPVRGLRAVPGGVLALDLLRARPRRLVRAAVHGAGGASGRPLPHRRARAGVRRRGGQRDRSRPERARRRGLRGRGDRERALADLQRRRLRHHGGGDRARRVARARGPGAGAGEGGQGGRALMAAVTFCVVVPETERLDRFLADQLALSRTLAARLIADKHVTRDGRPLRPSALLERGAVVTVELPPDAPAPQSYAPAHRDLTFVYEDEHLAVLDKPAGLVVHPGPGHWDDTLVNVLVGRGTALAQGATEGRPGIVHRLDRDTSGLLLVAKTDQAHRRLTPASRREAERLEALAPRQLLHAALLGLVHPVTSARLVLRSEWPRDLVPALAEAAADATLLAQRNPLQYLGFFASDE